MSKIFIITGWIIYMIGGAVVKDWQLTIIGLGIIVLGLQMRGE